MKQKPLFPSGEAEKSPSPKATTLNGYTLIAERPAVLLAGEEAQPGAEEKSDEEDVSTDSLLKPSKEDVKTRPWEDVTPEATPAPFPETVSGKETCRPKSALEFGFSLRRSPVVETPFHQNPHDPEPQGPVSPSPPNQFIRQPSPESAFSPRVPRRKPRPFSTGNIHTVWPGTPGEGAGPSHRQEVLPGAARVRVSLDRPGSHRSGHRVESPMRESRGPETPASPGPTSTFRRRCQTMDSRPHSGWDRIDRGQERTPRFMAGVTMRPSSRRSRAAPTNEPFPLEKPSPCLRRPPADELGKASDDPQRPCHQSSATFFTHAGLRPSHRDALKRRPKH